MRLTHFVKIADGDRPTIEASVNPEDPERETPIRISQNGNPIPIYMSFAEHDAIANLVWAHRPDSAIKDAEIVGDHCPARTSRSDYGCILKAGHLPVVGGQWTHINRDAYKWNDEPHMHDWEDSGPDTPPGGELCKHCGAARIVR